MFNIESFLRTLIRWEMRGTNPTDWQGLIPPSLVKEAKERQEQERAMRYIDVRKSALLSYLTLADLKELIVGPLWDKAIHNNWPPMDIVQGEFKKLIAVRNKVAHFRPVTPRDVRVAKRFAEDLADWTRNYRRIREYAPVANWSEAGAPELLERCDLPELASLWRTWSETGAAQGLRLEVCILDHHVGLTVHAASGSVNPTNVCNYLEAADRQISFLRVAELGESLCCYASRRLPGPKLRILFEGYASAASGTVEFLSSDQVRHRYEFAEREGVLPWWMPLPVEFQV